MTNTTEIVTRFRADTADLRRGVRQVSTDITRFERGVTKRMDNFDDRFRRSGEAMRRFGQIAAAVLAGASANQLRRYAEGFRALERALVAAGFAGAEAERAIVGLSLRTRASADQTALAVKRIARATQGDLDSTIRRVETLSKLLSVGGATAGQRDSVLFQLGQGLQAGALQGEDLASIRENAPIEFLEAIAERAGGAVSQLRDLGAQGRLTTEVVLGALDDLASDADKKFAQLALTGEEAFKTLETGLTVFIGRIDRGLGVTETLNAALFDLGEFLSQAEGEAELLVDALQLAAIAAASIAGTRGTQAAIAGIRDLATARDRLRAATEADYVAAQRATRLAVQEQQARAATLATLRAEGASRRELERAKRASAGATAAATAALANERRALDAVAAAQQRVSLATVATRRAMSALQSVMAFFGGPIGLAITAAAASMFLLSSRAAAAEAEFAALTSQSGALAGAVGDLEGAARAYARAIDATGDAQASATGRIVAETRKEFEAKKALLELEVERQRALQATRDAELGRINATIAGIDERTPIRGRNARTGGAQAARDAERADLERRRREIEATADLEAIAIERAERALATPFRELGEASETAARRVEQAAETVERARVRAGGGGRGGGPAAPGAFLDTAAAREAAQVLRDARTPAEELADAQARLAALGPVLTRVIQDEAAARGQVVAQTDAEARAKQVIEITNQRLVERARELEDQSQSTFQGLARDLIGAIRQSENLSDALGRVADRLLDIALDQTLNSVFGGGGGGGLFGSLLGGLFGGGGGIGFAGGVGPLYAQGGYVSGPGGPTDDRIPAMLSDGEFVIRASVARRWRPFLEALNSGRLGAFAGGGLVEGRMPAVAPPQAPMVGGGAVLAPQISVTVNGGGDDPEATGAAVASAVRRIVQQEQLAQLRPGGAVRRKIEEIGG